MVHKVVLETVPIFIIIIITLKKFKIMFIKVYTFIYN